MAQQNQDFTPKPPADDALETQEWKPIDFEKWKFLIHDASDEFHDRAAKGDLSREEILELVGHGKLTRYQFDVICSFKDAPLKIGQYLIRDELGKGGMGIVYRAHDPGMGREVAIKMLLETEQPSEVDLERFRREVHAVAQVNHPNVVTAYHAGEHEGHPYLVMEYIEGRDLGKLLKQRGKLSVSEAVNSILQVAEGMECVHGKGIIHRDLKPSNLLLANSGGNDQIKILDLGLARLLASPSGAKPKPEGGDLSQTGMIRGTWAFMAPEQAKDSKRADVRSDIYSLGCTLFFLLTKQHVYTASNPYEQLLAHSQNAIPSLKKHRPDVPRKLDTIFEKMVAKKPDDRYQSMTEVIDALRQVKSFQIKTNWIAAGLLLVVLGVVVGLGQGAVPHDSKSEVNGKISSGDKVDPDLLSVVFAKDGSKLELNAGTKILTSIPLRRLSLPSAQPGSDSGEVSVSHLIDPSQFRAVFRKQDPKTDEFTIVSDKFHVVKVSSETAKDFVRVLSDSLMGQGMKAQIMTQAQWSEIANHTDREEWPDGINGVNEWVECNAEYQIVDKYSKPEESGEKFKFERPTEKALAAFRIVIRKRDQSKSDD